MSVHMAPNQDNILDICNRKAARSFDIIARAEEVRPIIGTNGHLFLNLPKDDERLVVEPLATAEGQYLTRIEVPGQFFHRCSIDLKRNILGEFHRDRGFTFRCQRPMEGSPEHVLINCRAVLGPQFPRDRDDHILFPIILEALNQENIYLASFSYDTHVTQLMVLFTDTEVGMDGQRVQGSICITNSETGHSSLWIEPTIRVFGDMWISNRHGDNGQTASRFVHRGTLPTVAELKTAIESAKRIAQIGVVQYLENMSATVSSNSALKYLEDLTVLPRRFANIIEQEVKVQEFIQKNELIRRILQYARDLPLIQELQVRREVGKFIGLFENTAGRMAHLAHQINNG